jgi:hypothetical protein
VAKSRLALLLCLLLGLPLAGQAQNVFDPLGNGFTSNPRFGGTITTPDGSSWGTSGLSLHASSLLTLQDGSIWSSAGLAMPSGSQIYFSDGSVWTKYGLLSSGTSTLLMPDASLWTPIGLQIAPSKSIRLGDGTTLTGSGSRLKLIDGSVGEPSLTFYAANTSGFYRDTTNSGIGIAAGGSHTGTFNAQGLLMGAGSSSAPSVTDVTNKNAGLYWPGSHQLGLRGQLNHSDGGTAPSVTANCGSGPSLVGTNSVMRITVGSGGSDTSCTITFGTPYVNAPACTANNNTDKVGYAVTPSTTAVIITGPSAITAGSQINVICLGLL